jgi:SpoVK/Ycf46/Vps4 family AAA+-type ATPase
MRSAAAGTAFSDEAAYLEAQLGRMRLLVERAVAVAGGDNGAAQKLAVQAATLGESIRSRVPATEAAGIQLGLETLRRRFSLDDVDVDVILHTAATALDPSLGKLHSKLAGVAFHPWLDVGLCIQVHHDETAERLRARARFQPTAPLIKNRLVHLDRGRPDSKDNVLACELKLPARVSRLVLGSDPTGGASTYARLVQPTTELSTVILPADARAQVDQLLAAQPRLEKRLADWGYEELLPTGRALTVLLVGPPGSGKSMLADALAHETGKRLLVVEAARLLEAGRANLETELEELVMEARLQDAVVLFDNCEVLFARGSGSRLQILLRSLERFSGLVLLATHLHERLDAQLDRRVLLRIQLELLMPALREKIWRQLIGPKVPLDPQADLAAIAKRYELTGGQIKSAVVYAVSRAVARGDEAKLEQADLDAAAQAQLRGDLGAYAEKTRAVSLSLDVLILPPDEKAQIEEIINAGRYRAEVLYGWGFSDKLATGKGLVSLFSGDPGTGKTLAAEVIGAELGLPLHRVNPAKVVSKYVGETEKNLNEILAQAKSTRSILFFDEADALFATRVTKVESANDRFVNMETNFLLQQLERYEGIVILATNLETSIDQAFKRRIAYHVVLTFPKPPDRERIWRVLIPRGAPVAEIDYAYLGKTFELSGGHIKNAILRASYAAAAAQKSLDTHGLAEAAEKECGNAGKLFQNRGETTTKKRR